jgi:long-chain fatty acid transport protein
MTKKMRILAAAGLAIVAATAAWATNGDNLIGVGPVSRAMGGTGVAAPQDSITAIFANPSAMGFCPCGEKSEAIFGATIFDPTVKAKITTPMGTMSGTSQHDPFVIPAVGVTTPINEKWRFGFGAYGVSGMGVDYRNKGWDLDGNPENGYEGDVYSKFEVMKFSPMLSYQVKENFAVGLALQAAYNNLDLGNGGTHDYSLGAQLGAIYSLGEWKFGASYTTPQESSHARVVNFDSFSGDTKLDTLDLESPAQYVVGAAYQPTARFLTEVDLKYLDWSAADGYGDFDWQDQLVVALGAQYQATDKLTTRAGFNYAENPVNEHNGWDPQGMTSIQGTAVPTMGYETFRVIGFPAVVETHVTLGLGYKISKAMTANLEYMHAFEKTISEKSAGGAIGLESTLAEDAIGFSLAWAFE